MKPPVRHARTSDGVDIAYWAMGSGPAVILPPNLLSHVGKETSSVLFGRYERLAQTCTVIRYDGRMQGLSGGGPDDIGPCSSDRDLQSVIDALQLDKFSLLARDCAGPIAIGYAARHPKAVERLVLWHALVKLADYFYSPLVSALLPMVDTDWELYTKTMILAYAGWNKNRDPEALTGLFRASVSADAYKAFIARADCFDASGLLSSVEVPTLVLHRQNFDSISPTVSAALADGIPGARLTVVRGRANSLNDEADDEGMTAVEEFLHVSAGTSKETASLPLSRRESQILTLLALGEHNRDISSMLGLSIHTVERHIANVYAKIGARSRVEAAAYAMSRHLVPPPRDGAPGVIATRQFPRS